MLCAVLTETAGSGVAVLLENVSGKGTGVGSQFGELARVLDRLLAPPVALRPSVDAGPQGSNEDDLTVKLSEILTINNIIRNAMEGGKATITNVVEDWEFLQLQCALYLYATAALKPSSGT